MLKMSLVSILFFFSSFCHFLQNAARGPVCVHTRIGPLFRTPFPVCYPCRSRVQVIWRMMSHTLRFSAFIAVVMLSFALAFQAVFHKCDPSGSSPEGLDVCPLHNAFGSFGDSFVTVFSSALGGPDFEIFDDGGAGCSCNLPDGALTAGIFLMVVRIFSSGRPNPVGYSILLLFTPLGTVLAAISPRTN